MIPIWDKRILLPCGDVILPEQVVEILVRLGSVTIINAAGQEEERSLTGARFDRCTYQSGVNDTTVYERDLLRDEWGNAWTVIWEHDQFILHTSSPERSDVYACNTYDLEVTGHVPYSEDGGQ